LGLLAVRPGSVWIFLHRKPSQTGFLPSFGPKSRWLNRAQNEPKPATRTQTDLNRALSFCVSTASPAPQKARQGEWHGRALLPQRFPTNPPPFRKATPAGARRSAGISQPRTTDDGQTTRLDCQRTASSHRGTSLHPFTVATFAQLPAQRKPFYAWRPISDRLPWDSPGRAETAKTQVDAEKLKLAAPLRAETTVTLKWIAERLRMGSWTHLNHLLYWNRRKRTQ
jgi:hypothetical protein